MPAVVDMKAVALAGPFGFRLLHLWGQRRLVIGDISAHNVDDHKNDRCAQPASDDDQHQFHGCNVTNPSKNAIPAMDSLPKSADLAAVRPKLSGNSAHIFFSDTSALMHLSEKEDAPWMTIPKPEPVVAADSASSSPLLSLYWFCFTRFLQAARSRRLQTLLQSAQRTELHQRLKKSHPRHLPHQLQNKTTHHLGTIKGGRSDVSAFGMFRARIRTGSLRILYAIHIPQFEVRPC